MANPDWLPRKHGQAVEPLAYRQIDAAKALGISTRTLRTWTRAGKVPHRKIDGVVMYPVEMLRESLNLGAETKESVSELK